MAKKLLLDALVNFLGEFIDINEENLNLGVWSGKIILADLKLKTDKFLRDFDLNIVHGSIRLLEITIPWTSLLTSPIRICVSGLALQVGPIDIEDVDKSKALKAAIQEKIDNLLLVEKYAVLATSLGSGVSALSSSPAESSTSAASDSYFKQWVSKIIDNIEIMFSNLHVRYEDNISIPGRTFSSGITLESLNVSTCDEKWQISSAFLNQQSSFPGGIPASSPSSTSVYKMMTMRCLGIYWQSEGSPSLASLSVTDWRRAMEELVHTDESSPPNMQYVLSPIKSYISAKLTHHKRVALNAPKFVLDLYSSKLDFRIRSSQYRQLCHSMDRSSAIVRFRQPSMYTPRERPTYSPASAQAWWKYGCKLAIKRRRYIFLIKRTRLVEWDEGGECRIVATNEHPGKTACR
jgi:vacuolar protein sorting-associated protein 13A/C